MCWVFRKAHDPPHHKLHVLLMDCEVFTNYLAIPTACKFTGHLAEEDDDVAYRAWKRNEELDWLTRPRWKLTLKATWLIRHDSSKVNTMSREAFHTEPLMGGLKQSEHNVGGSLTQQGLIKANTKTCEAFFTMMTQSK